MTQAPHAEPSNASSRPVEELRCEFALFRLESRYQFYILMSLLSLRIILQLLGIIP